MTEKYDFLVIGGGSGGIAAARRAAEYGAKVAVFEPKPLGGTCVNVGCVPKKMMYNAALTAEILSHGPGYGLKTNEAKFDWPAFKIKRDAHIEKLNSIYAQNLKKANITHINQSAHFLGDNKVHANGESYTAKHILIATGSSPSFIDTPGNEFTISSDGFFELESQPKRVAVVGAGYIATELAGVLNGLGSEVIQYLRKDKLLREFDHEIGEQVMALMCENGVTIKTNSEPDAYSKAKNNKFNVHHKQGSDGDFDAIIMAIGRHPNTSTLNLEESSIETDAKGYIITDEYQNTNIPGIYAVGDVSGRAQLTPVAIAAGRQLAMRLFNNKPNAKLNYENIATVVFSHPPIGTVGLSEEQAVKIYGGENIKIYRSRFINLYYAVLEDKQPTLVKLITVGEEEKIVGCHICGDAADEIIQGFAVAVNMGAKKEDFDKTVAIHPTAAEELVTLR